MANPSLQIGDSNWAIKEDNLLGYSKAGTRFVPQPITMTRASAGTRVNSEGIVETVELLGSELVTNGDFANGTSGWTTSGGWSITDKATNSGSGGRIYPTSNSWTSGVTVRFSLTVSNRTTGYIRIQNPSVSVYYENNINTNDSFVFEFTTVDSAGWIIEAVSGFDGDIDNISAQVFTQNNLARVDYTDGTSSLLVEPERTNLITYSEEISQYSKTQTTVIDNNTTSPDGTVNASKVTKNGVSENDRVYVNNLVISNTTDYSLSAFIKNDDIVTGGVTTIGARIASGTLFRQGYEWNGSALSTTTFHQGGTRTNVLLEDYGNGWWKVGFSFISDGTEADIEIDIDRVNGTDTTAIFLWGCQLEEGSYATSYIPTYGTTVTRIQDQYEKTGISDLINSEEGVLFLEVAALSDDGTNRYLSISSSITPSDDYIYFRFMSTSNRVLCRTRVGGNTINTLEKTISDTTDFNKYAIKWKSGDYSFWINGVEEGVNTSATIFSAGVLNQIRFDFSVGSGTFPSKVKQLQVYDTALTDPELITLTTI